MAATSAAARTAGVASSSTAVLSAPISRHARRDRRPQLLHVARPSTVSTSSEGQRATTDARQAKDELLTWISGTNRGSTAGKLLRGQIEEAQVAVEACSPLDLDYSLLEGKWLLRYTTAADVVPIVALNLELPFGVRAPVEVGNIYQRFSNVANGRVENIIEFSAPYLLEEHQGVTFTVGASYEVRSGRRIALTFNKATVSDIRITPLTEALVAPAALPRGYLQQQLLLAIKEFKFTFPFRSAQQVAQGVGVGANYLLTYLDDDMLIGRASGTAGTFIFTRADESQDEAPSDGHSEAYGTRDRSWS